MRVLLNSGDWKLPVARGLDVKPEAHSGQNLAELQLEKWAGGTWLFGTGWQGAKSLPPSNSSALVSPQGL